MKVKRWLSALVLLSLSGCISQPPRPVQSTAFQANTPTASYTQPSRPANTASLQPTNTAQKPTQQTSGPTPEWTSEAKMTSPPGYASTIEKARLDLAVRLGLELVAIQFIRLSPDEFPADTLGCLGPDVTPRPIPAMVSGQVIILEVGGVRYSYHARKEQVVFCGPWQ
jgi:hypothetical protein